MWEKLKVNFYTLTFKPYKFIFVSFITVLLLLALQLILLEVYTRVVIVNTDNQTELLKENNQNYKYAILGTSHTNYVPILAELNYSIFNYGKSYTYPIVMYEKVKKLIQYSSQLDCIIVEADDHQFYDFSYETSSIYAIYSSLLYEQNSFINFYSLDREIASTLHRKILSGFKEKLFENKNLEVVVSWTNLNGEEQLKQVIERYDFFGYKYNSVMNKNSLMYYEKTIELALSNNIKVILIRHPLTNVYLNNMYPNIKYELDNYLLYLAKKYSLDIFDYRYVFSHMQELFANSDHLNEEGIKEFAEILNHQLTKEK